MNATTNGNYYDYASIPPQSRVAVRNRRVVRPINPPPPSATGVVRPSIYLHFSHSNDKPILAAVRKLLEFGDLEPDWDSYGAEPVALKAVQKAERLLSKIADQFYPTKGEKICPFDIAPRSDGGVQFEWRSAKGALEVEVHPSQGYGYLLILGQGESRTFEEGDDAAAPDILALLSRIIG